MRAGDEHVAALRPHGVKGHLGLIGGHIHGAAGHIIGYGSGFVLRPADEDQAVVFMSGKLAFAGVVDISGNGERGGLFLLAHHLALLLVHAIIQLVAAVSIKGQAIVHSTSRLEQIRQRARGSAQRSKSKPCRQH